MKTKDSEHLQWLHDRIVQVYGESENVDFLHRFREIIGNVKDQELEEDKYTIEEFRNYLENQDSYGDVFYYLNKENIEEANEPL